MAELLSPNKGVAMETKREPLQIGFGSSFVSSYDPDRKYVILNVEKGKVCDAAEILYVDGKEELGIAGTTDRGDIERIVDQWSLDRIIQATMNYFGSTEPKGRLYDLLRQYSKQKPRMLA